MARGTIQGLAINKNHYYINVACIQILLHWGANQKDVVLIKEIRYLQMKLYFIKAAKSDMCIRPLFTKPPHLLGLAGVIKNL